MLRASASKSGLSPPHYLGHRRLGYEFVRTKPRCAILTILRCSRAHLGEPHAVTQCARAHIKYIAAYSAFMFYFLLTLRSQSKVHKHLPSSKPRTSPEVRASAAPARLATLPNPARYVARAHERKRAPRLATPTYLVQCSFNCLCASLSLSLWRPTPKRFRSTPPKKSEVFRVRHGSGKWLALGQPGGVGRGQGFCVRHGRGRSLALGQATRWCATLRRALRGATRWCATL